MTRPSPPYTAEKITMVTQMCPIKYLEPFASAHTTGCTEFKPNGRTHKEK